VKDKGIGLTHFHSHSEESMAQTELRVLLELASSDTRIGAVNDALDLAHFTRPFGVRVMLCGRVDGTLKALARQRGISVVRGQSRSTSKLGFLLYALSVLVWMVRLLWLRPHVVHLNYVGYGPSLACAAYLCGIPIVARAGGQFHARNRANCWIKAYVANCEPHARLLLDSPLAERVFVAGDLFRPERLRSAIRPDRPIPPRRSGRVRFLFLGQLVERKGLAVLIEAFARMSVNADLLLVGGDWNEEGYPRALRNLIDRLGLSDRIYLENHRADIAALLANADVFVLPSLSEARPRSIIEAMLLGLPVVASSVGGIPTLVSDGVTGCLIPPSDPIALAEALDSLASSAELRRRLGEAGRQKAEAEFDPQQTARRYVELYKELNSSGTLPAGRFSPEPGARDIRSAPRSCLPQHV
jgi:glycosyltransferase involved in cell wall biosynthesis